MEQESELEGERQGWLLVAVVIRLEGTINGSIQILGLLLSQLGQIHIQLTQVGFGHCLIQLLRPEVSLNWVFI